MSTGEGRALDAQPFGIDAWLPTEPGQRVAKVLSLTAWQYLLPRLAVALAEKSIVDGQDCELDDAKFAEFAASFATQRAGRVSAPTLVLASADDQLLPKHHQRELAEAIVGARYQEVPGGHGLPLEDPTRFAAIVAEFIDAQQAAGSARSL
jgi:pimeloyl-ACP methyl ester carboxylesterase